MMLLLLFATALHVLFYISALKTHTLDYFFAWGNVHEWQGLDFYQVPNGAHAYLTGGELTGQTTTGVLPYSYGNYNVYHPLFTLAIGFFFQLFSPGNSFFLWAMLKLLITIGVAILIFVQFRRNKHLFFALFLLLTFFPQYLEIWNGQYHFLLNIALLFLLLFLLKKSRSSVSGVFYFLTLIVKPIGLLFLPALLSKREWKVILVGLGLFLLATTPFVISQDGLYYMNNLLERIQKPIGGPPGVFTLDAVLRFLGTSLFVSAFIKNFVLIGLLFIEFRLRPPIFQSLFFWTSYYLLFYDLVFEYHYTTLIPFFTLGVLTQKVFQKPLAKILMLSFSLPTPFFIFHFFQHGAIGHKVTDEGWVYLVLTRIIPLILLCLLVLIEMLKSNTTDRSSERKATLDSREQDYYRF